MAAFHKSVLRFALGRYQYWKIFFIDLPQPPVTLPAGVRIMPITAALLREAADEGLRDRAEFGGEGAEGFGLFLEDELVAVQWYWGRDRHWTERQGRSWPLGATELKSVGLYTLPAYRGRGYAKYLKLHTAHLISERGFTRIYSRIWHSHRSSIAVSERTGWRKAGSYIEIEPAGKRFDLRLPF